MSIDPGAMLAGIKGLEATGMMIADSKSLMHINRVVVLICESAKPSMKA